MFRSYCNHALACRGLSAGCDAPEAFLWVSYPSGLDLSEVNFSSERSFASFMSLLCHCLPLALCVIPRLPLLLASSGKCTELLHMGNMLSSEVVLL